MKDSERRPNPLALMDRWGERASFSQAAGFPPLELARCTSLQLTA